MNIMVTGNPVVDTAIYLVILLAGGTVVSKRRGWISFGKGNGSNTFTRKEFMSKESKKAIKELQDDSKLLQTKEMCKVLHKNLDDKLKEIGNDVKSLLRRDP